MANNKVADFLTNNEQAIENTNTATGNGLNANDVFGSMEDLSNQSSDNVENALNQAGAVNAGASTVLGVVETADLVSGMKAIEAKSTSAMKSGLDLELV